MNPLRMILRPGLGRCGHCMRASFRLALATGCLAVGALSLALPGPWVAASLVAASLAFALLASHLLAFTLRTTRRTKADGPAESERGGPLSRRMLFARFASALAGGLVLSAGTVRAVRAQEGCPSGTSDCGNGYCCPSGTPHFCPGSNRCYQYFTDAQADCGNNYLVCGR